MREIERQRERDTERERERERGGERERGREIETEIGIYIYIYDSNYHFIKIAFERQNAYILGFNFSYDCLPANHKKQIDFILIVSLKGILSNYNILITKI